MNRDEKITEARSYMSLGATAAQYAAGQVMQGLVRTDGDLRVLRSYLDNARRQIADAQEQLLGAMVILNDLERKS